MATFKPHKKTASGSLEDVKFPIASIDGLQTALEGKAASSHTHNYAGSSSAGGAANYSQKLETYYYNSNGDATSTYGTSYPAYVQWNKSGQIACLKSKGYQTATNVLVDTTNDMNLLSKGSATQPVYFNNGVPVATTYTLGKSVPSNAVFTDTTYSNATSSSAGLMSASDKAKLDQIGSGGAVHIESTTSNINITSANSGAYFKVFGLISGATELCINDQSIGLDSDTEYSASIEGILVSVISRRTWVVNAMFVPINGSSIQSYSYRITTSSGVTFEHDGNASTGACGFAGILSE